MPESRVRLPAGVREPFSVYVNGVRQELGRDYRVQEGRLVFDRELAREGRLGFWRWLRGAFGIGTYRRDDQVDVAWEVDGRPQLAHALEIDAPEPGADTDVTVGGTRRIPGAPGRRHGR